MRYELLPWLWHSHGLKGFTEKEAIAIDFGKKLDIVVLMDLLFQRYLVLCYCFCDGF